MPHGITMKGQEANLWVAQLLVKEHGDGARKLASGPMLADIETVLARRNSEAAAKS